MEPEASELPKGLALGRDGNIHIRITPLGDVGSHTAGHLATVVSPSISTTDHSVFAKLQGLLSLLVAQVLEREGLDSMGKCLNNLAADNLLSNEVITRLSSTLDQTRDYFNFFGKAL